MYVGDDCVRESMMELTLRLNKNSSLNNYLRNKDLTNLQKHFADNYQREGESTYCVNNLRAYAKSYYQLLKKSTFYQSDFKRLVATARKNNCHQVYSLEKTDAIKVSLHIMPKGSEIPTHAHPNQFSLLIVDSGKLEIVQNSWGTSSIETDNSKLLNSGDISIGLPIRDNLHQLKAVSETVTFFSIRMTCLQDCLQGNRQNEQSASSLFLNRFVASALCFLIPFMSSTSRAGEVQELYSGYKVMPLAKSFVSKPTSRIQAGRFRQSGNYNQQVEAVNWYVSSARRGNAESQYWLGVMHLDGNGTTEDDEEAFKWVSLSADQGYKPAVTLLDHLITSDFDLEC